jgi:hypothetical protein
MITLKISQAGDDMYNRICEFARNVYVNRHSVILENFPEIFAVAQNEKAIIGCFGLKRACEAKKLLLETYLDFDVLEMMSGKKCGRECLAEMGTRAVDIKSDNIKDNSVTSIFVSLALSISLITRAEQIGLEYLVFTATASIRKMAQILNVQLFNFGVPDLSRKDKDFLENWKTFFSIRYKCYGIIINEAINGCKQNIEDLNKKYGYQFFLDQ